MHSKPLPNKFFYKLVWRRNIQLDWFTNYLSDRRNINKLKINVAKGKWIIISKQNIINVSKVVLDSVTVDQV